MSDAEMVPVTQAARDAAASVCLVIYTRQEVITGVRDHTPFVQAFARAMLAAEAAAIERCAVVAEELPWSDDHNANFDDTKEAVATAIRSLKEGASHVG